MAGPSEKPGLPDQRLMGAVYQQIVRGMLSGKPQLGILVDPEKFNESSAENFLRGLPSACTHILVGGSTVAPQRTGATLRALKVFTSLPILLFPGDHQQIVQEADALLFLSLISGRNPEYLIGQQVRSVAQLRNAELEIIPTGYMLIEGGRESAVERVSGTRPMAQNDLDLIVQTALAGQYSGKKLIYLEAGSGAAYPVGGKVISAVKEAIDLPLIVGGGIRNHHQMREAYAAGADLLVMGTAFEAQ